MIGEKIYDDRNYRRRHIITSGTQNSTAKRRLSDRIRIHKTRGLLLQLQAVRAFFSLTSDFRTAMDLHVTKRFGKTQRYRPFFLTARDEETDMLTAFDTGADDYVVKPFSMKVLLKRIEAVIGRNNREKQLACGRGGEGIILFPDKKQVYKNEKEIILTAREYQLLEYFDVQSGKCTDERKYPGICMGTGWPVCSG